MKKSNTFSTRRSFLKKSVVASSFFIVPSFVLGGNGYTAPSDKLSIALIGCGAYGLPLAAHVKRINKQAIHMGGALQILFGIKGKRWDNHPTIGNLYNEYWVRPKTQDKPTHSNNMSTFLFCIILIGFE